MAARYRRSTLGLDYLFDERIPLAAILALASPFRIAGAAILADEITARFGHYLLRPARLRR